MQQPVAQALGFAARELAGQQQPLGPDDQVVGEAHDLQPDAVVFEVAEREILEAGVLVVADLVLDAGAGVVATLDLGDVGVGLVGEDRFEAMPIDVGERQLGAGKPSYLAAGTGLRAAQPLQPCRVAGDLVNHPKRRRARRHLAEQHALITDRTKVGKAVAAIGQHHRQIPDHATTIIAACPPRQPAELRRQRPRQADLVSNSGKQRAARMRHQALSIRRDIHVDPAPIVHHLQGDPPSRSFVLQQPEESPLRRTVKRPRTPGPPLFHAPSGLMTAIDYTGRLFIKP